MGFLDEMSRQLSDKIDWVKFEAEKLQRTTALQGELNELRRQLDSKRLEFGDRALDLFRAGKIQSPTLADLLRSIEALQAGITLKEEEVKSAQNVGHPERPSPPQAQSVPVSVEYSPPPPDAPPSNTTRVRSCPNCGFQMPESSVFCPSCGTRVTT